MSADQLADAPHHVYRYYDAAETVLYVGCTSDLTERDRQHRRREWYPAVRRMESETFANREAGRAGERAAIERYRPIHNVQLRDHNRYPHPPVLSLDSFVTVAEVARLLDKDVRTVHRMIARKLLEAEKAFAGKRAPYIVSRSSVDAHLARAS